MRVEISGFDDVLKQLERLSKKQNVDAAAKKAVSAAKGVVADKMRSAIRESEHGTHSTGSVADSVVTTATKVNSYGAYSVAKPDGMHPSGKRNGEVAAYLNYGSPSLQPARPWRAKACEAATQPCIEIMQKVLEEEFDLE